MNEYFETRPGANTIRIRRLMLNFITFGFLLASVILGGAYGVILINPQVSFNPYPPPTLPATVGPPTVTNTPAIYLPTEIPRSPTARPLPTSAATATLTPPPEETLTPTATETVDLTPPATVQAGAQFELQPGSPSPIAHVSGCSNMGVGGRVFDIESDPIINMAVRMGGELGGLDIGTLDSLTGSATDLFGFGGYYFDLGDTPIASQNTLWIQVIDPSSELPLSQQIPLITYDSCDQNLILVNFRWVGQ